jgi:chromosome segregation ATPase
MPPKSKPKAQVADNSDEQEECISLSTVKALMAQQESAFKSMIDSLIKSTTARVDGLVKEVAELKYSLQYSQKDIDSQQKDLDSKQMEINSISAEITNIKTSLNKFGDKTVDLENRSRRNNLRIVGIPEKPGETWEESEALVKSALKEKLGLRTEPRIERAHRTGKSIRSDSSQVRDAPRPIVCRLYDWKEKVYILKQARIVKPTGLFVNEDVAEATMAKRREQMPRLRQAKQDGKIAYFVLDKLIIKDKRPRQN